MHPLRTLQEKRTVEVFGEDVGEESEKRQNKKRREKSKADRRAVRSVPIHGQAFLRAMVYRDQLSCLTKEECQIRQWKS